MLSRVNPRRKDSISSVIRDAKGQSLELKAMLKRKSDPWDREVEFSRAALRKVYLQIIFNPSASSLSSSSAVLSAAAPTASPKPSSAHTARLLDVLNLLWLETSHALIHVYRAKVAEMDKTIADAPNAHRGGAPNTPRGSRAPSASGSNGGGGGGGGGGGRANNIPGPTARRRLIHSFRTFLGQEEDFFRALLARLATSLYPSDLAGLRALGVPIESESDGPRDDGEEDSFGEAVTPLSPEEATQKRNATVPLAHKALICFGDLARYRELYNEPGAGNPHAGVQPRTAAATDPGGKKARAKGDGERKTKNWTRAAECYHQARLLFPENGNPSNQLAVLSQYAGDHVSSTYHYYRALSVRSPFPTAKTNLDITYSKAVNKWFADPGGEPEGDDGVKFRAAFVALQGMYFTKTRLADVPTLSARVHELFRSSVEQRLLPSDLIVKTIVTGLCALWDARMSRSAGKKPHRDDTGLDKALAARRAQHDSKGSETAPAASAISVEPHLLMHVLSLYSILLHVGAAETLELVAANADASPAIDPANLALNISAVLRRALPALRILSKWLMGQLDYISRVEARVASKERKLSPTDPIDPDLVRLADLRSVMSGFWDAYVEFANAIQEAFPPELLPAREDGAEVWLEEDVDMLGFAPLRRGMKKDSPPAEIAKVGTDVHPNEEQLMRVSDVQADARLVAASDTSAVTFAQGTFSASLIFEPVSPKPVEPLEPAPELGSALDFHRLGHDFAIEEDQEEEDGDYAMTEDDPVDLAMRVATADRMEMDDDEEEEDDDEEIVFRPSMNLSNSQIMQNPALLPPLGAPPPGLRRPSMDYLNHQNMGSPSSAHASSSYSPTKPSPPVAARSIWAPTNPASSPLPPPINPSAVGSFESLPNTTHQAFAPASNGGGGIASAFARHPSFSSPAIPLPQPTPPATIGLARSPSLFGNFQPFAPQSGTPSRALPIPASFANPQSSDLSPHASVFARSPQRGAYGPGAAEIPAVQTGWPDLGTPLPQAVFPAGPPPSLFGRPFSHG